MPAFGHSHVTPFTQMRSFFSSAKCDHSHMDDAECWRQNVRVPDWKRMVRAEARFMAMGWIAGAFGKFRTIHQLVEEAKIRRKDLNRFILEDERKEFDQEFMFEVDSQLTTLIAMRRLK